MGSKPLPAETYQHSKLTSSTSIRLMRLMAGTHDDPLRCEIDIVDIEDELAYEAVSYVWGTTENRPSIKISSECHESESEIPVNLDRALRRFRHPSATRKLWVDNICINQNDDHERSQQVQLMGQIYRRASVVLIWLGEDGDEGKADKACKCMQLLIDACPKLKDIEVDEFNGVGRNNTEWNSFLGILRQSPDDVHGSLGIPLLHSPEFDALVDLLLKNSWFSRAWTWQESFVAKERKFFFGSRSWSDESMIAAWLVILGLKDVWGTDDYLFNETRNVLPMIAGLDFWTRRAESIKSWLELPNLLTLRRGSGCRYPSDLLYSLIDAARGSISVEVDYKQPFEAIFAKSAWQMMAERGTLYILANVEQDRQPSNLPTWVPDWGMGGNTRNVTSTNSQLRHAATGSSRPMGRLSDDTKVLTLSGLNWDRVSGVKGASSAEIDEWVENALTATTGEEALRKCYRPTNESPERALRRVTYLDRTTFTKEQETTRWKPTSHEHFEDIVQGALSRGQTGRLKYGVLLHSMIEARRSRSIFVTEGGRLGIASDKVLVGDVIAMLLGGEVPIVLRSLSEQKAGHYNFVAECYVHGFMDGESLVEARRIAQPEHDPADVNWLKELDTQDVLFPVQEFHLH